jgi:hypothetical protein
MKIPSTDATEGGVSQNFFGVFGVERLNASPVEIFALRLLHFETKTSATVRQTMLRNNIIN